MMYDSLLSDFMVGKHSRVVKQCNSLLKKLNDADTEPRRVLLNNRAISYLNMGMYRRCIKDATAASEIDPGKIRPIYTLVQALVKAKKMDEAKELYADWVETAGIIDLFWQKKIEIYLKEEHKLAKQNIKDERKRKADERKAEKKKKVDDKRKAQEKQSQERRIARMKQEKHETSKFAFADILIKSGHYKKAITEYTLLLQENQDLVRAYYERGCLYINLRKYSKATKDFENAVLRDRNNGNALMKLAEARSGKAERLSTKGYSGNDVSQEFAKAVKAISRAIKIFRGCDDGQSVFTGLRQRATIFRKQGNHEYALHDFQDALNLLPNHMESLILMALSLQDLGRYEDAIGVYESGLSYATGKTVGIVENNMATCYSSMGNVDDGETHFDEAIKAGHTSSYGTRGMYRYLNGNVQKSIKDMNKAGEVDDPNNVSLLQLRLQMRGVAYHSQGQYRWAEKDYTKILATNPPFPGMLSWFRLQMLPATQRVLDKPFTDYSFDHELHQSLKTAYVQLKSPKQVGKSYQPNNGRVSRSISDVNLSRSLTPQQQTILDGTNCLGRLMKYSTPGFFHNIRQQRMSGLAMIEIVQTMTRHWQKPIRLKGKGSSLDRNPHIFGWRDMMDIAVRWRQHSEPNDHVFWADLLDNKINQSGAHTKIIDGQKKNKKYYEYHDLCFKALKTLACEQQRNLSDFDKNLINEARKVEDVHRLIGHDFGVVAPVYSRCGKNKLEGTRIILAEQQPEGHCFSIQIPLKPERDESYDNALSEVFNDLDELKNGDSDLEQAVELCLSFYYYWVNYGVLSRGTAACGLIILNALLIGLGYLLTEPFSGIQPDWEAILTPTHTEFIQKVRGRMTVIPLSQDTNGKQFSELPNVSDHISTLREMIHVLNMKN